MSGFRSLFNQGGLEGSNRWNFSAEDPKYQQNIRLEQDLRMIISPNGLDFNSPTSTIGSGESYGEGTTPRRKLSMSGTTPRHWSMDSGFQDNNSRLGMSFSGSLGGFVCSTVQQSDQCDSMPPPTTSNTRSSISSASVGLPLGPLGDIQNISKPCQQTILAKRIMTTSQTKASMDEENTEQKSYFYSPSQRPASLPALSWHQDHNRGVASGLIGHINSPLDRMSLVSPTGLGGQRHSSLSSSDGYHSEVFEDEAMGVLPLSDNLNTLISGPFDMTNRFTNVDDAAVCPTPVRPFAHFNFKRLQNEAGTTREQRKRSSPDPNPECSKRIRKRPPLPFTSNSLDSPPSATSSVMQGVPLLRSQSVCMPVMEKSPTNLSPASVGNDEIGDFSKPFALPLVKGTCGELKCISPDSVSELLEGKFEDVIAKYTLVDCRFPYEYNGGHIRGAKNIWMQDDLMDAFFTDPLKYPEEDGNKREIIIFHCEFSSKRGPKMNRFLREKDRKLNGMAFPKLYYPELYLMEGGYKAFFQHHSNMCEPQGYCCMVDENHREELVNCKKRSKSWTGEHHQKPMTSRTRCKGGRRLPRREQQ